MGSIGCQPQIKNQLDLRNSNWSSSLSVAPEAKMFREQEKLQLLKKLRQSLVRMHHG